jgi:ribosomal protein S15P/S13E
VSRKSELRAKTANVPGASQARIDHLERLVHTLLQNTKALQSQLESSSPSDPGSDTFERDYRGNMTLMSKPVTVININSDIKERLSVNEAHWALLLNEIDEVRSHLQAQQKDYEAQTMKIASLSHQQDDSGPTLLFGSSRNMSRAEILSQLPSRYTSDLLVTRFWAHLYPAMRFLHQSTFTNQVGPLNDRTRKLTHASMTISGSLRTPPRWPG